jgi:CHRD domain
MVVIYHLPNPQEKPMKLVTPLVLAGMLAIACQTVQAIPVVYTFSLSGSNEAPPNASLGTGSGLVIFDTQAHRMWINLSFSGLLGTSTVARLHAPTAIPGEGTSGVALNLLAFPQGVNAGGYFREFDMLNPIIYSPSFRTASGGTFGAELALANAAAEGRAYFNLHTTAFPGGEIRGFLTPAPRRVNDGGSAFALLGMSLAGMTGLRRWLGFSKCRR